jgi:hypothetical protein
VAQAITRHKTRVIDFDLRSYFDNVRHDRLLAKVAKRVNDNDVLHLLHSKMGGREASASHDARSATQGLRLEAVE